MSDAALVTISGITLFAVVLFFGVIYFIYRLLRLGIVVLARGVDLQLPPFVLLVSFALAASIFTTGAANLWGLVYGLAQVLFVDFPRAVVEVTYSSDCFSQQGAGSQCFVKLAAGIANTIQGLFVRSLTYLTRVISLVQFFAAWAVIAWVIGDLISETEPTRQSKGLRRLINDMSPTARLRFGLGAIIAIGAYLCFCAIVAVSLFKPIEKPQVLDDKALEERLNQAKLANTGDPKPFSVRFPESLGNLPEGVTDNQIKATYEELTEVWTQLRGQVLVEQDRLVNRAVAAYKIENLNRVGSREQANHFLALSAWFQSAVGKLFTNLDECRTAISSFRWIAYATGPGRSNAPDVSMPIPGGPSARRTGSTETSPGGIGGAPILQPPPWVDPRSAAGNALSFCQARARDMADPPDRSDFGHTLGIVGDLSIWLLRTESMPLALITGLIGFGLFGALVSTFVRIPTGQSTQPDMFGVVWRGVSAAIVVFLAAYSGIAIVSQTGGDPNPYVVFVTCLVGAVFGDDVWLWAKDKFVPKEGGGNSENSAGGAAIATQNTTNSGAS
jgi:hypothetical protein